MPFSRSSESRLWGVIFRLPRVLVEDEILWGQLKNASKQMPNWKPVALRFGWWRKHRLPAGSKPAALYYSLRLSSGHSAQKLRRDRAGQAKPRPMLAARQVMNLRARPPGAAWQRDHAQNSDGARPRPVRPVIQQRVNRELRHRNNHYS